MRSKIDSEALWSVCGVLAYWLLSCAAPVPIRPTVHASPALPTRTENQTKPRRPISLPGLTLDIDSRELQIAGRVCITRGVLEYIAVAKGGKEYESIFSLQCRPSHLQVALLMAGYNVGEVAEAVRGDFATNADASSQSPPEGAPASADPPKSYWSRSTSQPTFVTFDVDLRRRDGTWQRRAIEDFLLNRRTGHVPDRLYWTFTGSFFNRDGETGLEAFAADNEKSLIALWYDPSALFNLSQDVGNPYRGDAAGLEVNESALPEKDTRIRLIIRPATPANP